MQKPHVLITGGSGLIGKKLTQALLNQGCLVSHLSRHAGHTPGVKTYIWNVEKGTIDQSCISKADCIIHLAGSGIADARWTDNRKQDLINSRTQSIKLIYNLLQKQPHRVTRVISASATGYYSDRGDELLTESSPPAHDFLGTCCIAWEQAVDEGHALGLQITKFRTGVVLTTEGGALPQLARPVKFGAGAALGNGRQYIPWIHMDDAVAMYLHAIESRCAPDVYNMAAPNPVTSQQLTAAVARQLHKPLWLPHVPAFALKLLFGEMSAVVLGSTRVSPKKIEQTGFKFGYPAIAEALKNIYEK